MPSPVAAVAAIEVEAITEAGLITGAVRFMPAVTTAVAMRWRDAAIGYHPVARTAVRRGVYRGAAYGAAASAAAAGAYGYYYGSYNNGCYQNSYGAWVCPRQYPY